MSLSSVRRMIDRFVPRMRIATALTLAIGLLTGLTAGWVAWQTLTLARDNTSSLLADRTALMFEKLDTNIDSFLGSALAGMERLGKSIEKNPAEFLQDRALEPILVTMVAAVGQFSGVSVLMINGYEYAAVRQGEEIVYEELDWRTRRNRAFHSLLDDARERGTREAYWGAPVRDEKQRDAFVNVRLPMYRGDDLIGLIAVGISVTKVSAFIDRLATQPEQVPFILYNNDRVLAHPSLTAGIPDYPDGQTLPTIAQVDDPVLAQIWAAGWQDRDLLWIPFGHSSDRRNGPVYVFFYQALEGFGDVPLLIGSHFPRSSVDTEIVQIVRTMIASVLAIALAMIVAYFMGHLLARPVERLANAARHVRRFEFDRFVALPGSKVREFDSASKTFNAMVDALRAFQTYVPPALVRHLVSVNGHEQLHSETRELTIMFTDLVGFTRQSENLDAAATAQMLNHHFEVLTTCIEAEGGTIDKYIGDSVMAFWNAPADQPDHATRALRAARAIRQAVEDDPQHADLRVRIGVHTGQALVGNIGTETRINYTIIGDAVNAANRLEALGKELQPDAKVAILTSAITVNAAGLSDAVAIGAHALRGRREPVMVYTLSDHARAAA